VSRCPSDLELEVLARGPERRRGHLAACPRCAARLAELDRLGEEFEREVFPATVEAVVAGAPRPRPRLALWLTPLAAAAAAAAVLLLRTPARTGEEGSTLSMVAYAAEPGGARTLSDGEALPPGAGLRFEVRPGRTCKLWIVSADGRGEVSQVYPPGGADGISVKAGGPVAVPGGAVLDGRPGPQRFFALCGCGDDPISSADVARAARAVGAGDDRVRAVRQLPGLPDDTLQATLLVEKRP
jgi:hypothetical protein